MLKASLLLLLTGCSIFTDSFEVDEFSGDPFPIDVDTSTGAVIAGIRNGGDPDRVAVIDLLSPFDVFDGGPDATPSISYPSLILLGADGVPRAAFDQPQVLTIHPCDNSVATCDVGDGIANATYGAIIGAPALAGDDLRLDLAAHQISILPNVAGDEGDRSEACDAVFPSPYRGGGTAFVGGTELDYAGRRIAIGACVAFDGALVPTVPQEQRGTDMLFVVSTSVGPSILGVSAYERYRELEQGVPPDVDALPAATVDLPSGPVAGHLGTLPSLALVGADQGTPRSPCREDYASHLLLVRDCVTGDDCPCEDGGGDNSGDTFCSVPGVVEMTPAAGFPVLVIPDDDPALQALRTELRPDQAELDGILGTSALQALELDADYPHDRALVRCAAGATDPDCLARPELEQESDRATVSACIARGGGTL